MNPSRSKCFCNPSPELSSWYTLPHRLEASPQVPPSLSGHTIFPPKHNIFSPPFTNSWSTTTPLGVHHIPAETLSSSPLPSFSDGDVKPSQETGENMSTPLQVNPGQTHFYGKTLACQHSSEICRRC
ncbi:hypothetical protein BJV77DRAFT_189692 [Russula vinacea]|nr:hypothetical protein BJV77DRAFT_189692 [Russula vinacea]